MSSEQGQQCFRSLHTLLGLSFCVPRYESAKLAPVWSKKRDGTEMAATGVTAPVATMDFLGGMGMFSVDLAPEPWQDMEKDKVTKEMMSLCAEDAGSDGTDGQ